MLLLMSFGRVQGRVLVVGATVRLTISHFDSIRYHQRNIICTEHARIYQKQYALMEAMLPASLGV